MTQRTFQTKFHMHTEFIGTIRNESGQCKASVIQTVLGDPVITVNKNDS